MKLSMSAGLICAVVYVVFVLLVPHGLPRYQGLESDFISTYVDGAMWLESAFEVGTEEAVGRWRDGHPFQCHGIGYPLALLPLGKFFDETLPGMKYFQAGKLLSAASGAAVILLVFIWLGFVPGLIVFVLAGMLPIFFEIAYSASTDMFCLALILWAIYALWREQWFWGGILLGAAILVRYEAAVFVPFALLLPKADWVKRAWILAPILLLLVLNFQYADFPPRSNYNLALHYLNDDQIPDMLPEGWEAQYGNAFSIFFSHPLRNAWYFLRDLALNLTYIVVWVMLLMVFFSIKGLLELWPKSGEFRTLLIALAVHLVLISFVSYSVNTVRYYWLEIFCLLSLGAWVIARDCLKWQYLPVALIVLGMNFFSLSNMVRSQMNYDPALFEAYRQVVKPADRIMSLRGFAPFLCGCDWEYFPVNETNLYERCLRDSVDFVMYGGMEYSARPEWRDKLRDYQNGPPEFVPLVVVQGTNTLFWVDQDDAVKARYGQMAGGNP